MGPLDTSPGFPLHLFCFSDFDTVDASSQAGPSGETGLHGRRFSFTTHPPINFKVGNFSNFSITSY